MLFLEISISVRVEYAIEKVKYRQANISHAISYPNLL